MTEHDATGFPPGFLETIDPEEFSIPQLIGLILVEKGEPMTMEAIAERLEELGVYRTVPSLRKSWSKLKCLRKTADGRLQVIRDDVKHREWYWFELRARRLLREHAAPPAAPPEPPAPVDERSTVTLAEVQRGLQGDLPAALSLRRQVALLTEASGGVLAVDRALELLEAAGKQVTEEKIRQSVTGRRGPVVFDAEKRCVSDPHDESFRGARRLLRERLAEMDRREEKEREAEGRRKEREERDRRRHEEEAEHQRRYRAARKAVIRCVFSRKGFEAATFLDPDRRTFEDVRDPEAAVAHLEACDYVFGIDPWADMERLGMDLSGRTAVDLSPPVKTVGLNKQGRTLRVTPQLIFSATLGLSRALGKPAKLREYLRTGQEGKLFRRLHADVKALWRLYEYGCLHGHVRLRWGFLDNVYGVDWNVGHLPRLYRIFEEAEKTGQELEVVIGSPPGWEDPWARGIRVRVVKADRYSFEFDMYEFGGRAVFDEDDIFAVRPWTGEPAPSLFEWPEEGHRVS
jgi:hypothetical protein